MSMIAASSDVFPDIYAMTEYEDHAFKAGILAEYDVICRLADSNGGKMPQELEKYRKLNLI